MPLQLKFCTLFEICQAQRRRTQLLVSGHELHAQSEMPGSDTWTFLLEALWVLPLS